MNGKIILILVGIFLILFIYLYQTFYYEQESYVENTSQIPNTELTKLGSPFTWCFDQGYPWSIPRISLPSCLGILDGYELDWWFYVGYLKDDKGDYYTFELVVIRAGIGSPFFSIINGGIKLGKNGKFLSSDSYGIGATNNKGFVSPMTALYIPTPTDTSFSLTFNPLLGKDRCNIEMVNGITGKAGSEYKLTCAGENYSVEIAMTDIFGGMMDLLGMKANSILLVLVMNFAFRGTLLKPEKYRSMEILEVYKKVGFG